MRIRPVVAATSLVALLPALAVVAPTATGAPAPAASAAKAAKVTLNDLPASAEVGQRLTVSGRTKLAKPAKGKKPKPVKVTVQRQYAGGAWQAVGTDTTDKKGRYATKVALTQGGQTSFRVVRGGSASAIDSLAVYEWLDLADQPQVLFAEGALLHRTSRVGGAAYPEGYELPNGAAFLTVKSAGLCTEMTAATGILDSETSQVTVDGMNEMTLYGYTPGSDPVRTELTAPVGPAKKGSVQLTGKTYALIQVGTNAPSMNDWSATILTPRLRCNAAVLPSIEADEVPV